MEPTDTKRYKAHPLHAVIFSVDLGQRQDPTAWAMCEIEPDSRPTTRGGRIEVMSVTVRGLYRVPLNTPYTDVQAMIHREFWNDDWWLIDEKAGHPQLPQLLVDAGGPGIPVVDNLARNLQLGSNLISYCLTSGAAQPHFPRKNYFTCPRSLLFQHLKAAFEDGRVGIDPRLEFGETLRHEIVNLRSEPIEETGIEKVVHRDGEHDDLVIAVG